MKPKWLKLWQLSGALIEGAPVVSSGKPCEGKETTNGGVKFSAFQALTGEGELND